jgi:hypothetical protein
MPEHLNFMRARLQHRLQRRTNMLAYEFLASMMPPAPQQPPVPAVCHTRPHGAALPPASGHQSSVIAPGTPVAWDPDRRSLIGVRRSARLCRFDFLRFSQVARLALFRLTEAILNAMQHCRYAMGHFMKSEMLIHRPEPRPR